MDDYIEIKDENGLTDLAPLNGPNELVTQLLFNMLVIIGAKDNFIKKIASNARVKDRGDDLHVDNQITTKPKKMATSKLASNT